MRRVAILHKLYYISLVFYSCIFSLVFFFYVCNIKTGIMNLQYVLDIKGKVKAIQVPLDEWEIIERKLEAYDLAESIKSGYKEMQQIERGELKIKYLEDFLNEI